MPDWNQIKAIFEELIERPEGQRGESLDRLCGSDAELRKAVEALIGAHEGAGTFLQAPTLAAIRSDLSQPAASIASPLPPRVGPYTPLEVIGEGGFGTVYRARQDEPVRRIVALKVIKPGMDSREVIARFEGERQALALMGHPNIAAVLDAGATSEGRPYFVMEYVPGEPITAYCDKHKLPLRDRLEVFMQVCHAVQHAHQKGIIHRDIKPSNILVADDREQGTPPKVDLSAGNREQKVAAGTVPSSQFPVPSAVPKVIDFGVAKATNQRLTEHSIFTQQGMLIGTPAYMSPEQAEMSELDIDTRSDIYSLGVVLYELLSGTPPFDPKTLASKGYAEIQRIIREVEPPKPSTRLSAMQSDPRAQATGCPEPSRPVVTARPVAGASGSDSAATSIADRRRSDRKTLIKLIRGDLDWIVMKCLEKDRARRYETANELALEIARYLNDEPVRAGPPTLRYRFRKFARRNRAAFWAIGGISVALTIGLAVSIAGFIAALRARNTADEQRVLAQRAAGKAEAVNRFLQDMLAAADPKFSARREITVREALDRAVAKLESGAMTDQPEIEAAVRLTVGRTYAGLAQFAAAERQIEAAVNTYRRLAGETSSEYADALQQRGTLRQLAGGSAEAEPDFRKSLAIRRSRPDASAAIAAGINDLACSLMGLNRYDEAETLLREAVALARLPENAKEPILAETVNNLGLLLRARQAWPEAEPLLREAIEVNRRLVGNLHPNVATNLDNLGLVLDGKGDSDGAERAYREALAIRRELFGSDHPDVATSLHNLATVLWARGDHAGSEASAREALSIFRCIHGLTHPSTLTTLHSLVSIVGGSARPDEAESLLLEAFEAARHEPALDPSLKQSLARRLVELYQAWSRPDKAAEWTAKVAELQTLPPTPSSAPAAPD